VLSAAGFALFAGIGSTGGLAFVIGGIVLVAVGTGPLFALGTGLIMASVPRTRAGAAASLSETSNLLGGTLGVALIGTVVAAVYQHRMVDAVPTGLTGGAARSAHQTVAGATAAARDLPAAPAGQLLAAAHAAYTHGFTVIGPACAVLFLGLAALIVAGFRSEKTPAGSFEPDW
jgi:DHA2 family multidrug resistance protein-like MFS transporter